MQEGRPCSYCEAETCKIANKLAWKTKHAKVREDHGVAEDAPAWSATHLLRGVPVRGERMRDCIDLAYQLAVARSPPQLKVEDLVVDVSQDGSRMAWAGHLRSVTRSSQFYWFRGDRLICAGETLSCLGFPSTLNWEGLSEAQVKDLVGEVFAVPCATTCILVLATLLPDLWSTNPFTDV